MNEPILECVPNFSEGKDSGILKEIKEGIESVKGVQLIHIDKGIGANRTVFTFLGLPELVIEAAFRAIQIAGERIDMRIQSGAHPRIGATDVCPLIPLQNLSMGEADYWAKKLAERVGRELNLAVYLYEESQVNPDRKQLSQIRSGEYEGLKSKLNQKEWKPDFGPDIFDSKRGATVIGARNILIAYNINLDTSDVNLAKRIAGEIRESSHLTQSLRYVKAIGWFIPEYGLTQVSTNLTRIQVTPVHEVFERVKSRAKAYGVKIRGSELIGLIPLGCLLEAGHFYEIQELQTKTSSDFDLIQLAAEKLGLNSLSPFIPQERVIEYRMKGIQKP